MGEMLCAMTAGKMTGASGNCYLVGNIRKSREIRRMVNGSKIKKKHIRTCLILILKNIHGHSLEREFRMSSCKAGDIA